MRCVRAIMPLIRCMELSVCHADGNMSTQLVVESVATTDGDKTKEVSVRLKDKVYPFYVNVCYRAYQDVDIIETWTEITNEEKKPVVLNQFASAYLPIRMALQPVWFVGERRAFGSGTVGAGHESDKEQGRGTQFAYGTCRSDVLARRASTGKRRADHWCGTLLYRKL